MKEANIYFFHSFSEVMTFVRLGCRSFSSWPHRNSRQGIWLSRMSQFRNVSIIFLANRFCSTSFPQPLFTYFVNISIPFYILNFYRLIWRDLEYFIEIIIGCNIGWWIKKLSVSEKSAQIIRGTLINYEVILSRSLLRLGNELRVQSLLWGLIPFIQKTDFLWRSLRYQK